MRESAVVKKEKGIETRENTLHRFPTHWRVFPVSSATSRSRTHRLKFGTPRCVCKNSPKNSGRCWSDLSRFAASLAHNLVAIDATAWVLPPSLSISALAQGGGDTLSLTFSQKAVSMFIARRD